MMFKSKAAEEIVGEQNSTKKYTQNSQEYLPKFGIICLIAYIMNDNESRPFTDKSKNISRYDCPLSSFWWRQR